MAMMRGLNAVNTTRLMTYSKVKGFMGYATMKKVKLMRKRWEAQKTTWSGKMRSMLM